MTLSYSSRFRRISKFRSSTFFCAPLIRRVTRPLSILSDSDIPNRCSQSFILMPPKMRIRSSSMDKKNRLEPGSPWRPHLPRSCKSIRRASWRSVPITCNPPRTFTSSPCSAIPNSWSMLRTRSSHSSCGTSRRVG